MSKLTTLIAIGVVSVMIGGATLGSFIYANSTTHDTTITVKKMFIDNSGKESHYMVVGTDGHTVELDRFPFDWSSPIDKEYGLIEVNHTYNFHCYGNANPTFYWYEICNSYN